MIDVLISIYLGYRNGQIAKGKGHKPTKWMWGTVGAFLLTEFTGWIIMVVLFYKGTGDQQEIMAFMANPVRIITAFVCGLGGYLLVKHRVDKLQPTMESDDK